MAELITNHKLLYENGKITLTGIGEVVSFDEKEITLRLQNRTLCLVGGNFKLEDMDVKSGVCTINGVLVSATYREKAEKIGIIKRLFK